MLLEDYYDALSFSAAAAAGRIPGATKWVDELRERASFASFASLM